MKKSITTEQLQVLPKDLHVHLIDVRSEQEYANEHIPAAVHIPSENLPSMLQKFSPADVIVCVCNHGGQRSQAACEYLYKQGFENAFYLEGGTAGWFDHHH